MGKDLGMSPAQFPAVSVMGLVQAALGFIQLCPKTSKDGDGTAILTGQKLQMNHLSGQCLPACCLSCTGLWKTGYVEHCPKLFTDASGM